VDELRNLDAASCRQAAEQGGIAVQAKGTTVNSGYKFSITVIELLRLLLKPYPVEANRNDCVDLSGAKGSCHPTQGFAG
jgi:hypothetical protein